MKILVTGATGFVGACVVRRMLQLGHEVYATVREQSDRWRIADLQADLRLHCCDLRDADSVAGLVLEARPQAVFHCATYGGFSSQKDSNSIFQTNCLGSMNLVRACLEIDFPLFINTGSSSEYGVKDRPMREDDLLEPLGDYGVTKAATTLFCRSEAVTKGLPLVTLRIFSPYGPWDDPKRLVPYVISSLLQGRAPQLSRPESVRDYIHIDDVVGAYEMVLQASFKPGDIFNIGSGVQSSLGEVVSCISKILPGPQPAWGATASQRVEPVSWVADRTKAASVLGWRPATVLCNGLANTVAWMKDNIHYYQ